MVPPDIEDGKNIGSLETHGEQRPSFVSCTPSELQLATSRTFRTTRLPNAISMDLNHQEIITTAEIL